MSIENLLAGLSQFRAGIQQLQQGRLINKANEAVKQIRMSEADDAQKRAQLQALSDQVALGIMQTGGTAQGSALAAQILAPKESAAPTTPFQAFLSPEYRPAAVAYEGMKETFREEAKLRGEQRTRERQEEAFTRQEEARTSKEARATLNTLQKDYRKTVQDINKATVQARNALKLLDSGSPLTAGAIGTMLARASGEVGNLTEMERAAFQGRPDLMSAAKRAISVKSIGELPEGDIEALKELTNIYINASKDLEVDAARTLAGQALGNPLFSQDDPNMLIKKITGGRVSEYRPYEESMPGQQQPSRPQAPMVNPFKKGFIPN